MILNPKNKYYSKTKSNTYLHYKFWIHQFNVSKAMMQDMSNAQFVTQLAQVFLVSNPQ